MENYPKPYVPLLRWRQGEYEALFRLGDLQKDATLPLIEILPPDYDFELRKPKKNLDEHLRLFGKRFGAKWAGRPALIDAGRLDPGALMPDGRHPLAFIFDEARIAGAPLIPLTGFERDSTYQAAVRNIALIDGRGAALRCSLAEALDPDFDRQIEALLGTIQVHWTALDIIIDLEAPAFDPQDQLVTIIIAALSGATIFNECRSVTLMSTSFPDSLATMTHAVQHFPRREWLLYKAIVAALPAEVRRPIFGDYIIAAINFAQGDMRFMRGSPNIRYTIDDAWIIARARGATRQQPGLSGSLWSGHRLGCLSRLALLSRQRIYCQLPDRLGHSRQCDHLEMGRDQPSHHEGSGRSRQAPLSLSAWRTRLASTRLGKEATSAR